MNSLKSLLGPMRVPVLILPPACVAVGVGTAYWQTQHINLLHVLLVLIGAVAAHMSVNAFNEYFDFKSGLDSQTTKTPFSGGSGTLPAHPELEKTTLLLSITTLSITAAIGLYFVWLQGWQLLPLGIFGLLLIVTYTIWWVYNPILSLVAPGLGFGILMVMGTHFALTGTYSWSAFMASLTPAFLVSNLLLLNQFPDVEADQSVGRKHYPIEIGRKASSRLYGLFLVLAYLAIIIGVIMRLLPVFCLLALLSVPLGWRAYHGAVQNADNPAGLIPSMGVNVIISVATPALVAIGLFLG
jgi:1,4-dihydroxy-2-naphthoate octaprenyltransferase